MRVAYDGDYQFIVRQGILSCLSEPAMGAVGDPDVSPLHGRFPQFPAMIVTPEKCA
jgi:hypothetical protein